MVILPRRKSFTFFASVAHSRRIATMALSLTLLAGCLTVKFVEDYDPGVYDGLVAYYEGVDAFMNRMAQPASQDLAEYDNPEVQKYYAESLAQLNTLLLRVEVNDDDDRCLPANYAAQGIGTLVESSLEIFKAFEGIEAVGAHIDGLENLQVEDELAGKGSCTTIVVSVVRDNHLLLQSIHAFEGSLSPLIVSFARPLIAQGVRIALTNEAAKKRD